MKALALRRLVLYIGAAPLLAACGGSQPLIGAPSATTQASSAPTSTVAHYNRTASSYEVVHSFGNGYDGALPFASLVDGNGTLYGTTLHGGLYGYGTVFTISTGGAEQVLHSFGSGSDGAYPEASLVDANGTLYGTTFKGGMYNGEGTVFSITATGAESVIYSFKGHPDGANPAASLVDVKGKFYGTTEFGGKYPKGGGGGTVFSISTADAERVLHSFGKGSDGAHPFAGLILVKGTLYGTTADGGMYGGGTVFSISKTGEEQVLHSFGNGSDGKWPYAALIDVHGTLYGTTYEGGTYGEGTVFSISTAGSEQVLYSFGTNGSGSDGAQPLASLIELDGTLYGTTFYGGPYNSSGTVFSISAAGTEHVLHSFGSGSDGAGPHANLVNVNGLLYSTTEFGGTYGKEYAGGVVFALSP